MVEKLFNMFFVLVFYVLLGAGVAHAVPDGTGNEIFNASGNVGVGSLSPGQKLDVKGTVRTIGFTLTGNNAATGFILESNGATGIGTWVPEPVGSPAGSNPQLQFNNNGSFGGVSGSGVDANGNVGIGSATPGQKFDVQGTVRTTGFTMSGQTPISGYVLTASNSFGNSTWTPAGSVGPWTQTGSVIFETGSNVGIGSTNPVGGMDVESTVSPIVLAGITGNGQNVGIGSFHPGQMLDVNGSVRMTGFTLTGNNAAAGFILQSNGPTGIGTWVPEPSGSSVNFVNTNTNDVYEANGSTFGNVGIGTTITNAGAALSVMNGNVGVGTWVPAAGLDVETSGTTNFASNVGIGSLSPAANLDVSGTGHFSGNVGIGTYLTGAVVTLGGANANAQSAVSGQAGHIVCLSQTAAGTTCLGYCSANVKTGTGTCTCQCI